MSGTQNAKLLAPTALPKQSAEYVGGYGPRLPAIAALPRPSVTVAGAELSLLNASWCMQTGCCETDAIALQTS